MSMTWTVESLPERGAIVVRTAGRFNIPDHVTMVDDILSRDFWRPAMNALFDHRQLDFDGAGYLEMLKASATHETRDDRIGAGKAAILMKNMADFGRGRMFQGISSDRISATLRIFTDEHEAREWLEI